MADKKYIIFDLDGTLIDSFDAVAKACRQVLACHHAGQGLNDGYFETYRSGDLEQMFRDLSEIAGISNETFRAEYDRQFSKDPVSGLTVIPRGYELLTEAGAGGFGIIILTNRKQEIAEEICDTLFEGKIDFIIGRTDTLPIKPRHVIIDRLQDLGINPQEQCIKYYGDSVSDFETAKILNVEYINTKI